MIAQEQDFCYEYFMQWSEAVDVLIAARNVDTAAVVPAIFFEQFFWDTFQVMLDGSDMCRCDQVSWYWRGATNRWPTAAPSDDPLPTSWTT